MYFVLTLCSCQTEGDLRLVNLTTNDSVYSFGSIGRLEIYWQGNWSTFCGLNRVGADVACSQMGYTPGIGACPYYAVSDYKKEHIISKASDDVPIGIYTTNCGYDNRRNSPLHLLRCFYIANNITTQCSHENDTILNCDPTNSGNYGYDTQVRLVSGPYPSSGTLEIYLNFTWGNVCSTRFNQHAADSVCRQMGYTNALAFNSTKTMSAAVVWLDGVECGSE